MDGKGWMGRVTVKRGARLRCPHLGPFTIPHIWIRSLARGFGRVPRGGYLGIRAYGPCILFVSQAERTNPQRSAKFQYFLPALARRPAPNALDVLQETPSVPENPFGNHEGVRG